MRERRQVICEYRGERHAVCPAILGFTNRAEKALVFELSPSAPDGPLRGEWVCVTLAGLRILDLREGPWFSGSPPDDQTCVADVEYDVNPQSPSNQRYRL